MVPNTRSSTSPLKNPAEPVTKRRRINDSRMPNKGKSVTHAASRHKTPSTVQMAEDKKIAYRLKGLPPACDRRAVEILAARALNLENDIIVKVCSLADSPYPQQGKIAILEFSNTPSCLFPNAVRDEWCFNNIRGYEQEHNAKISLVFDTHFRGFTPLHSENDRRCEVDLIAISGLGGHAFGSFKEKGGSFMWLRDSLPNNLPKTRILLYGYDTPLENSTSFQSIDDLGINLRSSISNIRNYANGSSAGPERPLILLGHSLGGIVIKQALTEMQHGDESDKANLKSVYGILFFGVPNQGMSIESLVPMVENQPNRFFLESLSKEANGLRAQRQNFRNAFPFRDSRIISFYETKKSPTAQKKIEGGWKMDGPLAILVDRHSATHGREWESEGQFIQPFNRNHSELVKFSKHDDEYHTVLRHLSTFRGNACAAIMNRFNDDGEKINSDVLDSEDYALLHSLAYEEMTSRRFDVDKAHPNTCGWILQHENYIAWISSRRSLLWIKGNPGAGKSTLMVYIYRYFRKTHMTEQDICLEFFFTRLGTTLQKTLLGMIRSLLHQLYSQDSSVRRRVRQAFEKKRTLGKVSEAWNWHPNELQDLFQDAVLGVASSRKVVMLVDALDEAGAEAAKEIVSYFHNLNDRLSNTNGSARICISCRHYPITATIPGLEVWVEKNNQKDIASFIKDELHFVSKREENPSEVKAWSELEDDLLSKASGIFQWARLVVPLVIKYALDGESLQFIRHQLIDVPAGLGAVYEYILKNVIEPRNRKRALHLMQWICLAERPLTTVELRYAMASDDMNIYQSQIYCKDAKYFVESDILMESLVRSLSGGLAEVTQQNYSQVVQLIHKSVNDFFMSDGFRFLFAIANENFRQGPDHSARLSTNEIIGKSQDRLLKSCLNYIKLGEVWLKGNRLPNNRTMKVEFPFITYATTFLFTHAEKAESCGTLQYDLIRHLEGSEQLFKKWVQIYRKIHIYFDGWPMDYITLLHLASSSNLQSLIPAILQGGTDIEERDSSGNRALHYAARRGHEKLTSILLGNGAKAGAKNKYGNTPLIEAAGHGHGPVVKLLLEGDAGINENSTTSGSALQAACLKGSLLICEVLIDRGAEVNAQGGHYGNALQAASLGGHEAVVQLLIDRGAEVNAQGGDYGNALQAASLGGHEAVVQLLIDRGAEVNAQGRHYGNALQAASSGGHEAVVQLLVDRGGEAD